MISADTSDIRRPLASSAMTNPASIPLELTVTCTSPSADRSVTDSSSTRSAISWNFSARSWVRRTQSSTIRSLDSMSPTTTPAFPSVPARSAPDTIPHRSVIAKVGAPEVRLGDMNGMITIGWPLAAVLALLTAAGALVVRLGRISTWQPVVTAAVRAVVQLTAVSLLITAVLASGWLTGGFVLLMFAIAAWTSGRRIFGRVSVVPVVSIAVGVLPVLALLFAGRIMPWEPVAVVPIAGILIGGGMVATSLAGRRALDELTARHGEYEAALALGLPPRDAALLILRPTAPQALVPVLDQTRTVGLVTLPGAYIGVLLGGGDPIQAGAAQLLVLVSLLAIHAAAVLVTVELVARKD